MNHSWMVAGVRRQGRLLVGLAVALPLGAAGLAVQPPGASGAVAGIISTVAGGVGGPGKATTLPLPDPYGVAYSARTGDLYAASLDTVREVVPQTDQLTTVAGTGAISAGPLGDGGPATSATVNSPEGITADSAGNVLISDTGNSRIRVVAASMGSFYGQAMTAGDIYTVAGDGTRGFSGDGGPAAAAELNEPDGAALDGAGNVLIADVLNQRIRVVAASTGTFYGRAMTGGDIYTVAGNGTLGFTGDGGPATAAELDYPTGVAADAAGNLLIVDSSNNRIRVLAARTGTFYGQAMTAGDIYTIAGNGSFGFSGDGGLATAAGLALPRAVTVDASGNVVIADSDSSRIRVVAAATGTFYGQAMTAGDIYTVAGNGTSGFSGDGGPATSAAIGLPLGVTVGGAGNLVITDLFNGRIRVVAESNGTHYGQSMKAGDIYTVAGNGHGPYYSGDGGPATAAQLYGPQGVAVDRAGNQVIADTFNQRIRVVAASTSTFYGQAMTAGDIYTVAGTGAPGYHENGGPAAEARFRNPAGIAVGAAGNLVIADTYNNRIRVVAERTGTFFGHAMKAGDIYAIAGSPGGPGYGGDSGPGTAARLNHPQAVKVDTSGNVLIADTYNNRIRVVAARTGTFYGQAMTAGDIYTIAGNGSLGFSGDGGPATAAELGGPQGVAIGPAGNVLIGDFDNHRIRVIAARTGTFFGQAMTAGDIYTIAGNGTHGFSGDGAPATAAELNYPQGVASDPAGNVLIADSSNNRIRVVASQTGTFYGQAMTAGDIYTIAGNGSLGFSGDGGPGTTAELSYPAAVAVDAGNVLIADSENYRIREVAG
jgi:hypothetical protein